MSDKKTHNEQDSTTADAPPEVPREPAADSDGRADADDTAASTAAADTTAESVAEAGAPPPDTAPEPVNEPAPPPPAQQPRPHPGGHQGDRPASARGLLFLVLLIALGALGLAGWLYLQQANRSAQQQLLEGRLQAEFERIREAADEARETADDAREAARLARGSIDQAIEATRRANTELRDLIADERARMADQITQQREALSSVESTLRSQRQQLLEMRSSDRVDWSLAEAEYLLRLGFQRLLMAEDVSSAIALLRSADAILKELDDADLMPAREAIARDLAALRAVPDLDVEGTWLRLQALAERVDGLLLFELTMEGSASEMLPEDAGWRERLSAGFRDALARVSDYLVIRRREQPYETLIDPQWEQLVRQNLRMQIAQAQAALLAGNPELYEASLTATRRWLQEFFDFNESDVAALRRELDALMEEEVTRDYPDVSRSLKAVQSVIDRRHAADGGSGP